MTMPSTGKGVLSVGEFDRYWVSTFNGAQYRWGGDGVGWQVKTSVADWHEVKLGAIVSTVYAGPGERFVET
jgi:hypothetical protein